MHRRVSTGLCSRELQGVLGRARCTSSLLLWPGRRRPRPFERLVNRQRAVEAPAGAGTHGPPPYKFDSMQPTQRYVLADDAGFEMVGESLPPGLDPAVLQRAIPQEGECSTPLLNIHKKFLVVNTCM